MRTMIIETEPSEVATATKKSSRNYPSKAQWLLTEKGHVVAVGKEAKGDPVTAWCVEGPGQQWYRVE